MRINCFVVLVATAMTIVGPIGAQQDDKKAQDVIANVRRAIGGKKLDAIRSLSVQGNAQRNVGNFQMSTELEVLIDLPDKYIKSEASNGGPMTIANVSGFNGDRPVKSPAPAGIGAGGAMIIRMGPGGPVNGGEKPTPEQQQQIDRQLVRSARQEVSRLMLGWLATTHPTLAAQYSYAGEAESPDGKAFVIDVKNADGFTARLFVDEKTDLPLMVTFQGPQPRMITSGGPRVAGGAGGQPPRPLTDEERKQIQADAQKRIAEAERQPPEMVEHAFYFDDWREVDGIRFPHAFRRAIAGATSEEWTINKVKVNPKIDPKKFETGQ
jgi:hypothetical protein